MHSSSDRTTGVGRVSGVRSALMAWLVGGGMLCVVGIISPVALVVALRGGLVAVAILGCATGVGLWIVRGLGLHHQAVRWQLGLAIGLGLGGLALAMLGLGSAGLMHRGIWVSLMAACTIGGVWRIRPLLQQRARERPGGAANERSPMRWLWLFAIGFGGLAIVGATMPPGILWPAEGNAYDVLEYHLGVPREYFEAGQITYLGHNIYGNFPLTAEMLYLLAIVLHGEPVSAVFTAKLLNVCLGMLAVFAVWLAGREFGRGAGVVAGLLAASCPFVTYLCGVAYVENGLLLFAALALGAFLRGRREETETSPRPRRDPDGGNTGKTPVPLVRWMLASGLLCGLACGCKYTGLSMVFLPLLIAVAARGFSPRRRRGWLPIAFVLGWAVTFGPWLVKNTAATGNPLFPLARSVFGERAGIWTDEAAERWHEGHLPAPEDRPLRRRIARLWHEVFASRLYGPGIGLALLAGVAFVPVRWRARGPAASRVGVDGERTTGPVPALFVPGVCMLMVAAIVVTWTGWTHLVGRFAIVLIVPAAVLGGWCWATCRGRVSKTVGVTAIVVVAALNLRTTIRLFTEEPFLRLQAYGDTSLMTRGVWPTHAHVPRLNSLARDGHRILMVGDARRFYLDKGVDYCVVFNRNPFAEAASARHPAGLIAWLRERGYEYVYVDWSEMRRLRRSRYGFWAGVDEALFVRLMRAGLDVVEEFTFREEDPPYGTLFKVGAEKDPARPE